MASARAKGPAFWRRLCRARRALGAAGAAAVLAALRHVLLAQAQLPARGAAAGGLAAPAPAPAPGGAAAAAAEAAPRPAGAPAVAAGTAAVAGEIAPRPADAPAVPVGAGSEEIWAYCAGESMYCACPGRIRWGNDDVWKEFPAQEQARRCNNEELGTKPRMNAGKHCECAVRPGSLFYEQRVSPGSPDIWRRDFSQRGPQRSGPLPPARVFSRPSCFLTARAKGPKRPST
ncbi:unnamed protein product, partial [Prorocentrum cordatum]